MTVSNVGSHLDAFKDTKLVEWMLFGDRGLSSDAMCGAALGLIDKCEACPYDPHDLERCRKLVEKVPEIRDYFPAIAQLSPNWKAIITHWDELVQFLLFEMKHTKGYNFPITYAKMCEYMSCGARDGSNAEFSNEERRIADDFYLSHFK